jgi:hypothetical protein
VRLIPTNVGVPWILEHLFEEEKLPADVEVCWRETAPSVYDKCIGIQLGVGWDQGGLANVGVPWILEHLFEEEKLPASMYDRYFFGHNQQPDVEVCWRETAPPVYDKCIGIQLGVGWDQGGLA